MTEALLKSYLRDPNRTTLKGITFRINYESFKNIISEEIFLNEILSWDEVIYSNNKHYFKFVLCFAKLCAQNNLQHSQSLFALDPRTSEKDILSQEQPLSIKVFTFWSDNSRDHLLIIVEEALCEIGFFKSSSTFEVRIFSLFDQKLQNYKREIESLCSTFPSMISVPEEIEIRNSKTNRQYCLVLLNLLIGDYPSFSRTYTIFNRCYGSNIKLISGIVKICNLAYQRKDAQLFLSSIALLSLFIENRLADIYEQGIGNYNDDLTLGQLINKLKNPHNFLVGIESPLNDFKNIRNNIIHFHKRRFILEDCFVDCISYLSQILMWCEDNGHL